MTNIRLSFVRVYTLIVVTMLGLGASFGIYAQTVFPAKSIRLVVPFTPGGVTDTSARLIAEYMSKKLDQQIIVENKPGASGNIGAAQVAAAEPDGYTLLLGFDGTMVINPHVFANIPFDTLKDFRPVGKIGDAILILVAYPGFKAQTLQEVIKLSKQPGATVNFGSSGIGSPQHVAVELLNQRTGSKLIHIPYKGGGQAMIDVQGGTIPLVYTAVAGAYPHIMSGRITAIAVSSEKRAPSLPNVPTFIESGISDFIVNSWVGIFAPSKTPTAVIERLNSVLNEVLSDSEVIARLQKLGISATPGTPAAFGNAVKKHLDEYGQIIRSAGIKLE